MDSKKVYIIDDGSMNRERLVELFEALSKKGNQTPKAITPEQAEKIAEMMRNPPVFRESTPYKITKPYEMKSIDGGPPGPVKQYIRDQAKIQNNDPCHCGSGKKFKNCCKK